MPHYFRKNPNADQDTQNFWNQTSFLSFNRKVFSNFSANIFNLAYRLIVSGTIKIEIKRLKISELWFWYYYSKLIIIKLNYSDILRKMYTIFSHSFITFTWCVYLKIKFCNRFITHFLIYYGRNYIHRRLSDDNTTTF